MQGDLGAEPVATHEKDVGAGALHTFEDRRAIAQRPAKKNVRDDAPFHSLGTVACRASNFATAPRASACASDA